MQSFISRTRAYASVVRLCVVGAILAGCSNDAVGPGAGSVETIVVTPSTATVSVGASLTLNAQVLDADGTVLTGQRVSWSSEDPAIAEVSQSGVVSGRKLGTVLIAASARGKDAFASVTVNPTPVASVRLSSTHRSMLVGEVAQLTAEALDAGGHVLSGRPITWTTSDASIATVTAGGLVTAVAVGGAIITATSEGKTAVASITVSVVAVAGITISPASSDLFVGQTTQLTAQLRDASGATLTGRAIIWSTNKATVATVTSQGLVTAVAQGTATITATSEGKSASATVNVSPQPVSAVILSPGQVTITVGQSTQLTVLVTDAQGQVLTGRTITYSSSNSTVATVSTQGVVTGIAPGTATITATSGGGTGTATVTVTPVPVASVSVTPSTTNVGVGATVQLTATPLDANGQPLTGRTATWTSGAPGLASVSSNGLVTGLAAGDAIIIATIDGKQGTAQVTVQQVAVSSVSVTPATASMTVGQTVSFTATTLDANGNVLTGRIVGWSSSDNTIATVSSNGVVTGVAAGSATITASSEGKSGSATVTVTAAGPAPIATISVSPSSATVNVAWSKTLTATARDANGTVITGAPITWSSSDAAVATVSSSGVVTGVSPGSATITAASGGVTGTASITVQLAPVDRIVVTPANTTLDAGQTVQLTATLYDQQNNVLTGRNVTWRSSDATKVTVDSTGLATAVKKGTVDITASSGGKSGKATVKVN